MLISPTAAFSLFLEVCVCLESSQDFSSNQSFHHSVFVVVFCELFLFTVQSVILCLTQSPDLCDTLSRFFIFFWRLVSWHPILPLPPNHSYAQTFPCIASLMFQLYIMTNFTIHWIKSLLIANIGPMIWGGILDVIKKEILSWLVHPLNY